jgi:hypothetical protein
MALEMAAWLLVTAAESAAGETPAAALGCTES